MSVGELIVSIIGDMKALHQAFSEINEEIGGVATTFQTTGAKMSSAGSAMSKAITVPLAAAAGAAALATNEAVGFEKQMGEVFTLLPGLSEKSMSDMEQDMLGFSKEMGVMTDEAVPALYQAISASVPKENVFDFLTTAQKAAVGGVTELETAVDGITSVVNAYGSDVIDATEASDLMFTAVKLGKTTFEELSSSLYNVLPYASSAGVAFGDVTAAISTLTSQGTPTAQATTQIRQAIIELSDSGSQVGKIFQEVAGVSFEEFIAQGHNTQEALQLLEGHADATGVGVDELFSSVEAGAAALGLTGKSTEKFTSDLQAMQESAGATETAYNRMSETSSHALNEIKASINAIVIELGDNFLPILSGTLVPLTQETLLPFLSDVVLPVLTTMLQLFGALPQPVQLFILLLLGLVAALGPALLLAGAFATSLGSVAALFASGGLFAGAGGVIAGALSAIIPLLPILALLAAAVAAVYLAFTHWDEIKEIAAGVWETIQETFDQILEYLEGVDLSDAGTRIMNTLKTAITSGALFPPVIIFNMLNSLIKKITGVSLYSAGAALMSTFVAGIKAKIQDAYNTVRDGLNKINRLLPHSPAKEGPFKELPNWDALFVDPVQQSLGNMNSTALGDLQTVASTLQSASSSTTNNYAGDEFTIQNVNLSADYPFEKFARDMEQYNRQKRIRKGIPS